MVARTQTILHPTSTSTLYLKPDVTFPNSLFFFFNDTATTEIYTLSLHDALPIYHLYRLQGSRWALRDAWLTNNLLHRGGKNLSTLLAIVVAATCIWAWRKKRSNNCTAHLRWPLRSEEHNV